MSADIIKENDQILGYVLTRKIGSGGYGDVWEAEAPGGLKKAIKIVYGYHDEKRAQSELKALDRIKEARHPFLLSLERIEIFNSQLIVVCELADKSLSDLANEYRTRKESGIPRDELIRYLNEAADALDYINATFGLQHLDIKPENILLVSGHAKVADFGLVKDLQEVSQSLMAGMTPAYAAPELFDGQPGPASDQYSLANVYQEMLTTIRPFPGTTPAQLAAQHMHGKPDLRPLPISDQPVVAKALSKDPGDRYKTCSQFVQQLSNRKTRKKVVKSRVTVRETADTSCNTVVFDIAGTESKRRTEMFSDGQLTFNSVELESFDPPECDPNTAVFQPTVIIGVGESCSRIVQKVKQRIVARHGLMDVVPAINLLCIDSDRDSLAELSHDRDGCSMNVKETLAVPLRRPEQYRNMKNLDLSWISRRWIYNVPRSLKVDGLRPLGRLVFADHFNVICDSVSDCIKTVTRVENIAASCESLDLNPPQEVKPRVILLSNISGGIGSGMTNDLAYTIRLMMAEQGINNADFVGMLIHGSKAGRDVSLATANAYAYMCELRHFADGGYPGDSRLGIPEFEDDLPFNVTYGLTMDKDKEQDTASDLDKIAEYICLSNTTRCNVFFDAAREKDKENEEFSLRSFGVSVCGPGLQVQGRDAVERLCRSVIDQWIEGSPEDDFNANQFTQSCSEELQLKLNDTTGRLISTIWQMEEWESVKESIGNAAVSLREAEATVTFPAIDAYFDAILDSPHWSSHSTGEATEFSLNVEAEVAVEAQQLGDQLSSKILQLLNNDEINFAIAKDALNSCKNYIEHQLEGVMKGLHTFGTTMQEQRQQFVEVNMEQNNELNVPEYNSNLISNYAQLRFQEFALRSCNDFYRVIKSCLTSTEEMIKKFCIQIDVVGQNFDSKPIPKRTSKQKPTIQEMLVESVENNRLELIRQIEKMILESIVSEGGTFLDILSDSVNWQQQLPASIREAAQSVLSNAFKKLSIDQVIADNKVEPAEIKKWLNKQLNSAVPFVTNCGGGATLLMGQPRYANNSGVSQIVADCFDVKLKEISGTTGDLVMCFEAEQILLANFAFSILKEAPEATEIAKRIQSRDDVDWTTLADLM